jgi:hypothetical protein
VRAGPDAAREPAHEGGLAGPERTGQEEQVARLQAAAEPLGGRFGLDL